MAKKDFSKIDTGRERVQAELETATEERKPGQQGTAGPDEQRERIDTMKTAGRKGCHAPRINLAFSGPNYDFVRVMSRIKGQTLTSFVNWIIDEYRAEHPDLYEKALALIAEAEGREGKKVEDEG